MQMGTSTYYSRHAQRESHWHIPEVEAASSSSSYPRLVEVLACGKGAWLDRGNPVLIDGLKEAAPMQTMCDSGVTVVSECAIDFLPGDARRVFVSDVFESSFMTVAQVLRVS